MSDDATTSAVLTEQLTTPATRRQFLGRLAVAAGGATFLSLGGAKVALADPVTDFGNAAVGAERIGIAFYGNALSGSSGNSMQLWGRWRCPVDDAVDGGGDAPR